MVLTVAAETHTPIDYILYVMGWVAFQEAYNWVLQYKFGYERQLIEKEKEIPMEERIENKWVYDEENQNWIPYVEAEKARYKWVDRRNCYVLPRGE